MTEQIHGPASLGGTPEHPATPLPNVGAGMIIDALASLRETVADGLRRMERPAPGMQAIGAVAWQTTMRLRTKEIIFEDGTAAGSFFDLFIGPSSVPALSFATPTNGAVAIPYEKTIDRGTDIRIVLRGGAASPDFCVITFYPE